MAEARIFVLLDPDLYVRASVCDCATAKYERNAALIFDVSLHKDDSSFTARKCPDVLLTES